jgi:hypothetical protein
LSVFNEFGKYVNKINYLMAIFAEYWWAIQIPRRAEAPAFSSGKPPLVYVGRKNTMEMMTIHGQRPWNSRITGEMWRSKKS